MFQCEWKTRHVIVHQIDRTTGSRAKLPTNMIFFCDFGWQFGAATKRIQVAEQSVGRMSDSDGIVVIKNSFLAFSNFSLIEVGSVA